MQSKGKELESLADLPYTARTAAFCYHQSPDGEKCFKFWAYAPKTDGKNSALTTFDWQNGRLCSVSSLGIEEDDALNQLKKVEAELRARYTPAVPGDVVFSIPAYAGATHVMALPETIHAATHLPHDIKVRKKPFKIRPKY